MEKKNESPIELTINVSLKQVIRINEHVIDLVKLATEIQKEYNVHCTLNVDV